MLENERIIVQDRGGIDAGIAALMQNANKGFDPAALMAMMNNGNGMFGGNGGWWMDLHHRALLDVGRMGWKWLRSWKPSRNKL